MVALLFRYIAVVVCIWACNAKSVEVPLKKKDAAIPKASSCSEGEEKPCKCADNSEGIQVCNDRGTFLPCRCSVPENGTAKKDAAVVDSKDIDVKEPEEPEEPEEPGTFVIEPEDEATYIYDDSQLRTYELLVSSQDLAFLNQSPAREEYVQGKLRFEDETYEPIEIRYKGSWGGFEGCVEHLPNQFPAEAPLGPKTCPKVSIKVKFNSSTNPEGRFYGLKKLQFHSMSQDNSLMRERLGYALFNEMEVPTARAVHARLLINGQFEGLFVLVEQIDGRFTRSRFTEGGKGNLYKEIWPMHSDPTAYLNALESNTEENPSVEKMLAFKAAIESGQGVDAIDGWMDLDHQMRYIAVDRTLVNDDGIFHFWCLEIGMGRNPAAFGDANAHGNHNYYWYEEEKAQRIWLIPWDLDMAFKGNTSLIPILNSWDDTDVFCACGGSTFVPQRPPGCDLLVQHWASLKGKYEDNVRKFLEGPFSHENVTAKLDRWAAQIDEAVREQASTTHNGLHISYRAWTNALSQFRNIIEELRFEAQARIR